MSARLEGRTALISGGSRGIGEAIAARFALEGATVLICSRKQAGIDAAAERIRAAVPGADVRPYVCHNGESERIVELFTQLDADGICVDILVNNAATNPYLGPMIELEYGAWDKTFDVNVKGYFEMSRQVARRLIASDKPGSIINVASVFGMGAAPFQGIYGMSKAAILSMTKSLAFEWGGAGLRVNAIAPGLVDTKFASAITSNPAFLKTFTDRAALHRYAEPEEIVGAALFLASSDASFVTGQTLVVDGGYTSS